MTLYIIGSLKNPEVPLVANAIRALGINVFDDWFAAGPEADDYWREYEKEHRGHTYAEALEGFAARHVFNYDRDHLDAADGAVLVLPAGKSSHLELGYIIGQSKPGWILMEGEPERFDVMYKFANGVYTSQEELLDALRTWKKFMQSIHHYVATTQAEVAEALQKMTGKETS